MGKKSSPKRIIRIIANRVEVDYPVTNVNDILVTDSKTKNTYTYKSVPTLDQLRECLKKLTDHESKLATTESDGVRLVFWVRLTKPSLRKGYLISDSERPTRRKRNKPAMKAP